MFYSDVSGCPCAFCTLNGPGLPPAPYEALLQRQQEIDMHPRTTPQEPAFSTPAPTQCKFRCLSLTLTHKGEAIVKLKPVIAKNGDWPGGSEENARFWKASPSGECELQFANRVDCAFEPGAYYLVDIEAMSLPDDGFHPDRWKLYEVTDRTSQLALHFDLGWSGVRPIRSGTFKVDIENRDAWPPFLRAAGSSWRLRFRRVDAEHSGCPYTG